MNPRQGPFQFRWFMCILLMVILVTASAVLTMLVTSTCYFHVLCSIEYDGQETLLKDPSFWTIVIFSILLMVILIFIAIKITNINRINRKLAKVKPLEMKPIRYSVAKREMSQEQPLSMKKSESDANQNTEAIYSEVA